MVTFTTGMIIPEGELAMMAPGWFFGVKVQRVMNQLAQLVKHRLRA